MSVQVVILGLLSEKPRHGYELRQEVEHRAYGTYINLSGGSLYYNLNQLERAGRIRKARTEQKGRYPTRHVFEITAKGTEFLHTELRRLLFDIEGREKLFDPLNAALAFGHLIGLAELRDALSAHLHRARERLRWVKEQKTYWLHKGISLAQMKIIEHGQLYLKAEAVWLERFLAHVEGRLTDGDEGHLAASGRA